MFLWFLCTESRPETAHMRLADEREPLCWETPPGEGVRRPIGGDRSLKRWSAETKAREINLFPWSTNPARAGAPAVARRTTGGLAEHDRPGSRAFIHLVDAPRLNCRTAPISCARVEVMRNLLVDRPRPNGGEARRRQTPLR